MCENERAHCVKMCVHACTYKYPGCSSSRPCCVSMYPGMRVWFQYKTHYLHHQVRPISQSADNYLSILASVVCSHSLQPHASRSVLAVGMLLLSGGPRLPVCHRHQPAHAGLTLPSARTAPFRLGIADGRLSCVACCLTASCSDGPAIVPRSAPHQPSRRVSTSMSMHTPRRGLAPSCCKHRH